MRDIEEEKVEEVLQNISDSSGEKIQNHSSGEKIQNEIQAEIKNEIQNEFQAVPYKQSPKEIQSSSPVILSSAQRSMEQSTNHYMADKEQFTSDENNSPEKMPESIHNINEVEMRRGQSSKQKSKKRIGRNFDKLYSVKDVLSNQLLN